MKTIVFIHGMWVNGKFLDNYIKSFSDTYNCVSLTLPYHNESDNSDPKLGKTSFQTYVDFCIDEIKKLNLGGKPVIIGHSMGGLIAQKLAEKNIASKAVCISPASPYGIAGLQISVIKAFLSGFIRWGFWRKPHKPTFGEFRYAVANNISSKAAKELYDSLVFESGRATSEIGLWSFDFNKSTKVGKIDCPLLAIVGSKDRITPAKVVKKVVKKYGADFKEFHHHAHLITIESGWEKVLEYIKKWLEKS